MSTNDDQAAQRLGHAVRVRREQLGLSQLAVWQRGGPSNTTLTNVENGRLGTLTNTTAKRLDRGLMWVAGSAMAVWREAREPQAIATVGGGTQDERRNETDFVEAPGVKVESGITNEDLLREILRSRSEYDQLRAEVRENHATLSDRVARLEQRGS